MGSDMVVALSRATMDGRALFGHNSQWPASEVQTLICKPGRMFAPGQVIGLRRIKLSQVRQTWTVLAGRPAGMWGYHHGINEHGVAIGLTHIRTRLRSETPGLDGQELTRLALERATCARQAVDVLTDLVSRHGQGAVEGNSGEDPDNAFLIVDAQEAFVLEAAGNHWAEQEVKEVRAVGGLCHLRQDWDRISRGLADLVIARGWWAADGTKVDFAEAVGRHGEDHAAALRRWGRATLQLEEQNCRIDRYFLRRLLAGTEEGLCEPPKDLDGQGTAASLLAELGCPPGEMPLAWVALGPPSLSVYFPVCLAGDLPPVFADLGQGGLWRRLRRLQSRDGHLQPGARAVLAGLQVDFDQLAQEFKTEAAELKHRGEPVALHRLATSFMEHTVERFEEAYDSRAGAAHVAALAP